MRNTNKYKLMFLNKMHKFGDYTVNNYDLILILSSYAEIDFTKQIFMNISNTKFYLRAFINFRDKTNTIIDGQNRFYILLSFYAIFTETALKCRKFLRKCFNCHFWPDKIKSSVTEIIVGEDT